MNFDLTEDQKLLVETAQSFVKKSSPVERLRKLRTDPVGWEPSVWKQMGELGWLSLPFPESVGGYGGRFIDLALVLERFGTTLVPEPLVPSLVLGGMSILFAGTPDQQKRWLEPLIAGDVSLALAYAERQGRYDVSDVEVSAERRDGGWVLSGEKIFVLNGHAADVIVVSATTGAGVSLFAVDRSTPGLKVQTIKTMDGHKAAMLHFEGAKVDGDRLLGEEGKAVPILERVMDYAAAAAVAEGVGIMQASLDMTVEYLKTREQFGVKIGVFQALQHRAVDMFVHTEITRSLNILSALKVDDTDDVERRSAVSAAKVQLARGGKWVTQQGIQLHGGIGVTDEADIGLYFKRMHILNALFGDEEFHTARFASLPSFTDGLPT